MKSRYMFVAVAVALAALAGGPASAQECPCDCYFSGDCENGNFCDWGVLGNEDTCFWRTPKPNGSPGAGCTDDYNNWGQCDGICAESLAVTYYRHEDLGRLAEGVTLWADVLTDSARSGGGLPNPQIVAQVSAIPYQEERMLDSMWRIAVEVLTLTRGEDFMIYPQADEFLSVQARVKDLSDDAARLELGDLAIKALVAEIYSEGSGRIYIDRIQRRGLESNLDDIMFTRICPSDQSRLECLYSRITDMGNAIGRGGRDQGPDFAYGTAGCGDDPNPPACEADVNGDGTRGVDDIIRIILAWNTDNPLADTNGDNYIDVDDVVMVVMNWGACPSG